MAIRKKLLTFDELVAQDEEIERKEREYKKQYNEKYKKKKNILITTETKNSSIENK